MKHAQWSPSAPLPAPAELSSIRTHRGWFTAANSMRASSALPLNGHDGEANALVASSQQSMPILSHPISPLSAAQLELLLRRCCQACPLRHVHLVGSSADVVDDDAFNRTTTFLRQRPYPSLPLDAVKEHVDDPRVLSLSTVVSRYSEIGSPITSSARLQPSPRNFSMFLPTSKHPSFPSPVARSLNNTLDDTQLSMTTATSIPGSPPDLSGSRSSKSSSYCSTADSEGPDGLATDVTNFEEIGLDDDKHGARHDPPRPELYKSRTADSTPKATAPPERRPNLPDLQSQIREAIRQKENEGRANKGPRTAQIRRGFTSPISPFAPLHNTQTRPRSSSPPKRIQSSMSTTALSADSLRPNWTSRSSLPLPPRRGSWQPNRRSVQELEAECHESDEELPDDASLWNVPVSPHPGDHSRRSSFRGSPGRGPMAPSPRPIPLEHVKTAPDAPPHAGSLGQKLPRQRRPPVRSSSLNTSLSNPSSPRKPNFRTHSRTNSWNLAMSELSEEARILSEHLEHHAETQRLTQLEAGQIQSDIDAAMGRRKASHIQLPPVQKGNLDFMPISKEKEAILSRTRPSWLPPKDPKEERKHLKEYQRMMAASLEAEKKRSEQAKSQQCQQDEVQTSLNRIWQYYSDETTDLTEIDSRVFELCWRGISSKLRGKVWQRAVGNELGLNARSFEKALSRAEEIQGASQQGLLERERVMNRWFVDIERDAETAFPELKVFQRHGPLWHDLIDVCKAYVCYRGDIGYLYGLQLVAALILLQAPGKADAFILLANCMNRAAPLAFQSGDFSTTARTYNHAVDTLAVKFPRLHEYLFGSIESGGLGFGAELIFEPMLRTLFCNGLDIDRLCRVWDIWVFEGDKTLVKAAVAILGCLQTQLFEVTGDIDLQRRNIQEMLAWGPFNRTESGQHWRLPNIDEEKFVEEIRLAGMLDYRGR